MDFDLTTLVATPKTWLETRAHYEGAARAEFTNPPGAIEGPATVCVNSAGRCRVRIRIEKIDAPDEKNFALGSGSVPLGTYLVNGMSNPCRSLKVKTERGVFTGGDRIVHDGMPFGMRPDVELRPLQSRFEVMGAAPAKYWVLPLVNFMPDPWKGEFFPQLADHPLRLASWPALPEGLSEHDQLMASLHLYQRGGLYTFVLNGEPGFIERMPNYEARAKRVRRKRSRMVTAVMVGPAHVQNVELSDFASLFPLDILSMLTLATGTTVGAPWIEFRDEKGALVRRVHICFGARWYDKSTAAIHNNLVGNGPGYLTGKVLTAADRGQKYLRVAINHALQASNQNTTLESRFISLCRGFETLCRRHGFINQDLSLRLEPAQQTELKAILREVAAKIRKMQKAETDPGRKAVLETICSKAQNAGQREKSFGLAVADLAQKFGFHDAAVLDAHFTAHPHPTGKPWPGVLTFYRAAATHDAYFDWSQREDLYTILRVRDHLHDLMLRVLFKTIGYDGPYQSPIPPLMQRDSVDWVTPTTPPGLLGFA
jgi:hypothetical protein